MNKLKANLRWWNIEILLLKKKKKEFHFWAKLTQDSLTDDWVYPNLSSLKLIPSKRRRNVSEDEDDEAIRHNHKKRNGIQSPQLGVTLLTVFFVWKKMILKASNKCTWQLTSAIPTLKSCGRRIKTHLRIVWAS